MQEVWKPIKDYEGLYEVSNLGGVKSLYYWNGHCYSKREKILKLITNNRGYLRAHLIKNKKGKFIFVHKLVAEAFVPNFNNYKEINHLDENKQNNHFSNIEWCDRKHNVNYGNRNKNVAKKLFKPVIQYDLQGNFIKRYESVSQAAKELNTFNQCISKVCRKEGKTSCGYIWRYESE